MGEAKRRAEYQQHLVNIDLQDAKQKMCPCGCKYFMPAIEVFTVSAILSPTGRELTAQRPALICLKCNEVLEIANT